MRTVILGAGLSGISTAYFLQELENQDEIILLEKECRPGGLCRSMQKDGYVYDIGPHILFSKDKEMLHLMDSVLEESSHLKRSNQILYKGRKIQYPFENDLSKLPEKELEECIQTFNNNPYEDYPAGNMLQFFLKTFGEGITNIYLRPYNEKIWKYDPSFMDTSMVERIPKPTAEEIRRSAAGETIDGYLHQLYFQYPSKGGIEAVPQGFIKKLNKEKCRLEVNSEVVRIEKCAGVYQVYTSDGNQYTADQIVSTMPVQALAEAYAQTPEEIKKRAAGLRYNSIAVVFVKTPYDLCGEHFAFMVPDKNVIFHRISKMDFLGPFYHRENEAAYMAEITYRKHSWIDRLDDRDLYRQAAQGLADIGFATRIEDVELIDITKCEYAYVVYDLYHSENMEKIRSCFSKEGIFLNGRFGNFEYWNMDRILRESFELVKNMAGGMEGRR